MAVFGGMPYRAAQSTCVMSCDATSRRAEGPSGRSSYSAERTPGSVNASCLAYGPGVLEVVMRPPIIAWNTVAIERRMVISGTKAASVILVNFGTFRTSRHFRLESVTYVRADVRRRPWIYEFTPYHARAARRSDCRGWRRRG